MSEPGSAAYLAARNDPDYWRNLAEVLRAENAALRDAAGVVCLQFFALVDDGSFDSARIVLLHKRADPLLAGMRHLRKVSRRE